MKKMYMKPITEAVGMDIENVIATSGVTCNNGIGYGGVDTQGTETPDVKEDNVDLWY